MGASQDVGDHLRGTSDARDTLADEHSETNPVYAEQLVEISSSQLEGRCLRGWRWGRFQSLARMTRIPRIDAAGRSSR